MNHNPKFKFKFETVMKWKRGHGLSSAEGVQLRFDKLCAALFT